ncbi:MAG: 4-hydroxy-tetrahydrodipicolinate synthase [Rhizobiales bacterium]|nr:4-hydroxy-tetrahydrodipicolinate synthase [Hyphomicrobiales bacterium]NRB15070.1 4-hydroxy-tetrahydrodipicolinate synthase [Hyphomicrobiales bacterium]
MFKNSIPAMITPMKDGKIDEIKLADFIEWQIQQGSSGLVPVGTTGESPTLSHDEHKRVVDITVEVAAKRVPVMAGAGSNNTLASVEFVRHALQTGADAALVVTPYYNKPNQAGLYAHFKAINDAADLPVYIYNIPGRSIIDCDVDTMKRLFALPNIVGVKDATSDMSRVTQQRIEVGLDYIQLSGDDMSSVGHFASGGAGCISVTANVAPRQCADLFEAMQANNFAKAREIQDKLMPLHMAMFLVPSPAPAKYALSLLGKCEEEVRLPILTLPDNVKAQVRQAMSIAGVLN